MAHHQISSVIVKLNDLLLTANALLGDSGVMENAEKIHGFRLREIPSDKFSAGFYYAVVYKDPDTGEWLTGKKATYQSDRSKAVAFAIEHKETIIQAYRERKGKKQQVKDGEAFYKMLGEYFQPDSRYLKDDEANNSKRMPSKQMGLYNGFIYKYLIPYLRDREVADIKGITKEVYSGLKIHLAEKRLSPKTINNRLTGFIRILKNHLRNELIDKLPYSEGNGYLRAESKPRNPLPARFTAHLEGIIAMPVYYRFLTKEPPKNGKYPYTAEPYLVAVLGLLCGMRNSEIARLKRSDIKQVAGIEGAYYIKCLNEKTKQHHRADGERYRKLPIHPVILDLLIDYINTNKIGPDDYIFGSPKMKDGEIDGHMNPRRNAKALRELYSQLKAKEAIETTGNITGLLAAGFNSDTLKSEIKKDRISFYSLRHTFETLFEMKHKGDTILNNYFMSHKPTQAMLGNYLHINKVGDTIFWDEYGKHMIEFQEWFIHKHDEKPVINFEGIKNYLRGKIDDALFDEVFDRPDDEAELFLNEMVRPMLRKKQQEADTPKTSGDKVSRFFGNA